MTNNKYRYMVYVMKYASDGWKLVYSSVFKDRALASYSTLKTFRLPRYLKVVNRFDDSDYHIINYDDCFRNWIDEYK